jgi:hypothetical protein
LTACYNRGDEQEILKDKQINDTPIQSSGVSGIGGGSQYVARAAHPQ